jgi:hypothetical protein
MSKILKICIRKEQSRYDRELHIIQNEINNLDSDFRIGESQFPSIYDNEKGLLVSKSQELKSDIKRLYREIKRIFPPSLETYLIKFQAFKSSIQQVNSLRTASIIFHN